MRGPETSWFRRAGMPVFCAVLLLAASLFVTPAGGQPTGLGLSASPAQGTVTVFSQEDLDAFAPAFVVVKLHFKRSEEEVLGLSEDFDIEDMIMSRMGSAYQSYLEQKRPQKLIGIVVGPDLVLSTDAIVDESYLDYIEVDDLQGGVSRAERFALLVHAPGLLFKVQEPAKLKIRPVEFVDMAAPVGPESKLYELKMDKWMGNYLLAARRVAAGTLIREGGAREPVLFCAASSEADIPGAFSAGSEFAIGTVGMVTKSPTLLVNAEKRPVGVGLISCLPNRKGAPPLWLGRELLQDERIPYTELERIQKGIQKQFDESLHEIRITFRQKAEGGLESLGSELLSALMRGDDDDVPKEMYCYGLPISARTLFVPERMKRDYAKVIDKISLEVGDGKVEGQFYGAYEDIAGFLVRVDEDLPTYRADVFSKEGLTPVEPLVTVHAERKFGGKKMKMNYTRTLTQDHGYKDILEPIPLGNPSVGTLFTDRAGKIRAVLVEQRKEDEETEPFRAAMSMFSPDSFLQFQRVYTLNELAAHFSAPRDHFDSTIVSLPEEEEKRKMWLGVEFEPMTRELARSLSVEKPTKDGTIGFIVSTVYADSPAARMGLATGDILLKIKEVGEREPIELKAMPEFDFSFDLSDLDIPREIEAVSSQWPKQRPWKTRMNLLTGLLEAIGEGKKAELTYLDKDRQPATKQFEVAKAPPDFESAAKFKDKDVGLTVKEITYEVRNALMLPKELNAVVVAKVEQGSPAAVARIKEYELILKIDETEVAGIDAFKKIVTGARTTRDAEGKVTLRFMLQQLGKTRFADLTLEK